MMEISTHWVSKLDGNMRRRPFAEFVQRMANRLCQGALRYGDVDRSHNYMTRMIMEVKAYKRMGNAEHLYNIANYCMLETMAPENKRFHFDPGVGSATRK